MEETKETPVGSGSTNVIPVEDEGPRFVTWAV
jgi:hypothetical protein